MRVRVRIDAERTTKEFKDARRNLGKQTRMGVREAGQKAILPHVRRRAPSKFRNNIIVESSTGARGFVTTRGSAQQLGRVFKSGRARTSRLRAGTVDRTIGAINFGALGVGGWIRPMGAGYDHSSDPTAFGDQKMTFSKGRAVMTPWGPKSWVRRDGRLYADGSRSERQSYRGKHFIEKGIDEGLPDFKRIVLTHILSEFNEMETQIG